MLHSTSPSRIRGVFRRLLLGGAFLLLTLVVVPQTHAQTLPPTPPPHHSARGYTTGGTAYCLVLTHWDHVVSHTDAYVTYFVHTGCGVDVSSVQEFVNSTVYCAGAVAEGTPYYHRVGTIPADGYSVDETLNRSTCTHVEDGVVHYPPYEVTLDFWAAGVEEINGQPHVVRSIQDDYVYLDMPAGVPA